MTRVLQSVGAAELVAAPVLLITNAARVSVS
jgi:hypothetical protein